MRLDFGRTLLRRAHLRVLAAILIGSQLMYARILLVLIA